MNNGSGPDRLKGLIAAVSLVGDGNVERDMLPSMAAEDFAWFLEQGPERVNRQRQCGDRGMLHHSMISIIRYCRWARAIG
jgi:hypothetical protein